MPLQLEIHPLPPPQESELLKLLNASSFADLKRVVQAKALKEEVEATNRMAQGFTFEKFTAEALADLERAKRYRFALEVLEEIQKESVHSTVIKINTT